MIQMPVIDNEWLSSTPKAGAGKSLSVEPRAEKETSRSNDVSETSLNNKSDFSSRNEFQSTLKNKLDGAKASPATEPKDDKMVDGLEAEDGETSVSLGDSDTMNAPIASAVLAPKSMMSKVKSATATPALVSAQSIEHRLAWNSFLHKMKEKLGVSAQDILSSFKSLNQEELKQPPEQNIAKMVQQLGLNDQQAAMAHQFFKELIVRTDSQPLNQDARMGLLTGPLAATSQQEMRQQKTEQSLQQMNNQFFMKPQASQARQVPQASQERQVPQAEQKNMMVEKNDLAAISAAEPSENTAPGMVIPAEVMKASAASPEVPTASMKQVAEAKVTKAFTSKTPAWQEANEAQAPSQQSVAAAPLFNSKMMPKTVVAATPSFDPNASAIPNATPAPNTPIPVMPLAPAFGGAPERNHDDGNDDNANTNVMLDGDEAVTGNHKAFTINNNEAQNGKELGKAMPTMAVPDFVQQAHVMMKDGGGEMQVVLTPEGLGEVAMKVSVKDGKVNVEMVTQSDEAKKVLESTFHALRDGLSTHHLNLETIKIDTASSLSTQLEQQYKDAQRNQAQQFLEQFHQDNRGWRQSYFDIPGAQVYRSQTDRTAVGPANLTKSSAGSRRLDLVA